MPAIVYPSALPGPQTAPVQWAERRMLSALPGPRDARAMERDQRGTQDLSFIFTAAEAAAFAAWYDADLIQGGAWFAANWPAPNGTVRVRRFAAPPQWQFVPGGLWRVSAQCEVRGRGEPPWFEPERDVWLWLRGEEHPTGTIIDSSVHHRTINAFGGAAHSTDQAYQESGSIALLADGDYLTTDNLPLALGRWTIEFAVFMPPGDIGSRWLMHQDAEFSESSSDKRPTLRIWLNSGGGVWTLTATGYSNSNGNIWQHTAVAVPQTGWALVRVERNATHTLIYVDGVLASSVAGLDGIGGSQYVTPVPVGGLQVGRGFVGNPNYLRTYIDAVSITTEG